MRALLLLLGAALAVGCELPDGTTTTPLTYPCERTAEDAQVAGTWRLTGTGSRSGCDDELLDAPALTLSAQPLPIRQDGATLTLDAAGGSAPPAFSFLDARVDGTCVEFDTLETQGGTIRYRFRGARTATGIQGVYESDGPGACTGEGSFSVTLE